MTKTIVLIHGAWLNSLSFENVKARYEAKGYTVIVPDWPFDNRAPAALRANPAPELATVGQREIVARALLHLADVAMTTHDRLRAHGLLDEAIAELESARLRPQLALAYSMREQLARADHDDAAALRFAHKYAAEREELLGGKPERRTDRRGNLRELVHR